MRAISGDTTMATYLLATYGAFGVIKFRVTSSGGSAKVQCKLFETDKGSRAVLERTYQGPRQDIRDFTHRFRNAVVKYYTGEPGFFGSKVAFVTKRRGKGKGVCLCSKC